MFTLRTRASFSLRNARASAVFTDAPPTHRARLMGNSPGAPEFPAEDVARVAGDVMAVFAPMYLRTLPSVAQRHAQAARRAGAPGGGEAVAAAQLLSPPEGSEPLLRGDFEKRGAVRTNWKRRHFVATNRSDNFVVLYFATEADSAERSRAKGRMQLDGYVAQRVVDPEEQAQLGCGALALKLTCGRRRTWFLRFPGEEALAMWEAAFQHASRHSEPPCSSDPAEREAFNVTYHRLRWHFNYWGPWRPAGTEEEMLTALVADECNRECLGPVYYELGRMSPSTRRRAEAKMEEMVEKTAGAVVGSSWKAASAGARSLREHLADRVRSTLEEVAEQEARVRGEVQQAVAAMGAPALDDVVTPVLMPLLAALLGPVCAAFVRNIEVFGRRARELGGRASGNVRALLAEQVHRADQAWGFMGGVYATLRALTRSDDMQALMEACPGVYRWTVEGRVEDQLRRLHKAALHTLRERLAQLGEPGPTAEQFSAALTATTRELVHDSTAAFESALLGIFMDALGPRLKRHVIPGVQEAVSSIADDLPEWLRELRLLDVDGAVERAAEELLEQACRAAIAPAAASRAAAFEALLSDGRARGGSTSTRGSAGSASSGFRSDERDGASVGGARTD